MRKLADIGFFESLNGCSNNAVSDISVFNKRMWVVNVRLGKLFNWSDADEKSFVKKLKAGTSNKQLWKVVKSSYDAEKEALTNRFSNDPEALDKEKENLRDRFLAMLQTLSTDGGPSVSVETSSLDDVSDSDIEDASLSAWRRSR